MPDFAMCQNSDCQMSWNCLRFNAPPDAIRQSYADFAPDFRGNCEFYWAMGEVKIKIMSEENKIEKQISSLHFFVFAATAILMILMAIFSMVDEKSRKKDTEKIIKECTQKERL